MKLQQEVRHKSEDVGDAVLLDVVGRSVAASRLSAASTIFPISPATAAMVRRSSNFTVTTIPTLRPKLRIVPRRSFSMAMAFDCSSAGLKG
jgi:hypothetical protein